MKAGGFFPRLDPTRPAEQDKSKQGIVRHETRDLLGIDGGGFNWADRLCDPARQASHRLHGRELHQAPENCQSCNDPGDNCDDPGRPVRCRNCRDRGCERCRGEGFTPGPPAGTITYPYYTIRGPRDFLANNPPSIGP